MSREIKFRAWDRKNLRMYYKIQMHSPNILVFAEFPNEFNLLQFTGLLDKNGVEIYEGDVVQFDVGRRLDDDPEHFRQKGLAKITPKLLKFGGWQAIYCRNVEVIGNIYEHPRLLQDNK